MPRLRHVLTFAVGFTALSSLLFSTTPEPLRPLWEDLASNDAAKAYRAIWTLTRTPDETVAFLRERVKPAVPVDAKQAAKLIDQLQSDSFNLRDQANRQLEQFAEQAKPHLVEAIARKSLPLEAKRRLHALLQRANQPYSSADQLRQLRAVETLELIGSENAVKFLKLLAEGAPEAHLTKDSLASVQRLANKPHATVSPAANSLPTSDLHDDPLPKGALARLGTTRFRGATRAVFAPDGITIVGTGFNSLHCWSAKTGKEMAGFPKQAIFYREDELTWTDDLTFSPDGKLLATNHRAGEIIHLWEWPSTNHRAKWIANHEGYSRPYVNKIVFSANSKTLFTANERSVHLIDTKSGNEIRQFVHTPF